jgi:type II secretory pathway pseudopilin PulG
MTLFEAVVALVILSLSAVSYLEVFQGDARAARNASDWTHATATAESAMEAALAGNMPEGNDIAAGSSGVVVQVQQRPWRGRVDDVIVEVRMPDGRQLQLRRLTRRAP